MHGLNVVTTDQQAWQYCSHVKHFCVNVVSIAACYLCSWKSYSTVHISFQFRNDRIVSVFLQNNVNCALN